MREKKDHLKWRKRKDKLRRDKEEGFTARALMYFLWEKLQNAVQDFSADSGAKVVLMVLKCR